MASAHVSDQYSRVDITIIRSTPYVLGECFTFKMCISLSFQITLDFGNALVASAILLLISVSLLSVSIFPVLMGPKYQVHKYKNHDVPPLEVFY